MRELTGAEQDVAALLDPGAVAIVGASSRPGALSWWPLHLLAASGYSGAIYPINPNRDEIDGIRCYPSLGDVPGPIDVAIIALDAERSLQAIEACGAAGVRAVVLPSQGFGELGDSGRERQARLAAFAGPGRLRIVGPNTDGVANLATGAIASIQPLFATGVRPGAVAVVTQSGATAASLMVRLHREGIGCRYYASAGNEADLGLADFLSVVVQDPEVKLVLSFVEAVRRPADFLAVAACAAELGKPIALIKIGATDQGARRAAAHTGALAGSDECYDALFRDYGVIRAGELGELVAVAKLFLTRGAPRSRGLGIMSVSGGQAGAIADHAARIGLTVPPLSPAGEAALDEALEFGSGFNPCDLTGAVATQHDLAARVFGVFDREPAVDTVIYARKALTGRAGIEAAALLAQAAPAEATPLAVYAMDGEVDGEEAETYARAGIPVFASVAELGSAVAGLADWVHSTARSQARGHGIDHPTTTTADLTATTLEPGAGGVVTSTVTAAVLAAYGIATPREELVTDAEQAVAAARRIGHPVVLKIASDLIPHKSEAGGVLLGIPDDDAVRAGCATLLARAARFLHADSPEGLAIQVQEQITGGTEMIVGAKIDPAFGQFVVVGTGGVLAELIDDVVIAPAPVDAAAARELIERLRGAKLLHGYRGAPPGDLPAFAELVARFSRLAADHAAHLWEADLNPVLVRPSGLGAIALDALLVAADPAADRRPA